MRSEISLDRVVTPHFSIFGEGTGKDESQRQDRKGEAAMKTDNESADSSKLEMIRDGGEVNANGHPLPGHWKRAIAIIWSGQAVSILATCAATFAVLWYVTTTTDSAFVLSLAGVAALLPTALLSPFGGVVADRFNRKHVMIWSDGLVGLFSLALAILVALGICDVWILLLLLVVRSAAQAFHSTSLVALMPELVPERDMVRINTLDQTLSSISAIAGPVLGIALYTAWGFTAVLVMDAACAAFACVCLAVARLPYAKGAKGENHGIIADLREGLAVIGASRGIRALLILVMTAMLLFLPLGTLSPLMTYDWFGGDGFQASIVEAAAGIGLLLGSVVMLAWGGGKRLVPILAVAGMVLGACCVACGLLPRGAFPVFVGLIVVIFGATAAFNAPVIPLMQKRVAPERFGRVMGIFGSLSALASPIGLFIAGPAAEALGVNTWFVVCGCLLCAVMPLALLSRNVRSLDD